jgi:acyl carrier protein
MTMELQILKNEQTFEWNFEEINKELADDIKKYTGLVVSETNLADMEKTQKKLAGLRIRLQKFRLEVKKDLDKPYQAFELQFNKLAELVESAEKPIKDQLQKYEDIRKEAKRNECQNIINAESLKLGLESKYSSQIVIDSKWINRGTTIKAITEEIQVKVCWFLDIQKQEKEAETFRQQKIEMAKFMIESLSKDLVTPLTFQDVENKIDSLNIAELRTYIENQVQIRKEREERAIQQAREQEEQKRIAEVARQEREEQARIANELASNILQNEPPVRNVSSSPIAKPKPKLYNVQYVVYGVTSEQIIDISELIAHRNIEFKHAVKEV